MDFPVILHILSYNHNLLHHLVSKSLSQYGSGQESDSSQSHKRLPISLLLWMNIFREYTTFLLCTRKMRICVIAASVGNLSALQWARSQGCPWESDTCSSAASNGHLEVLQWARSQGCPWESDTCSSAASNGHLEVLQWARSQGCPWDSNTCSSAASNGHLAVLQWARSQGCPWD